MTSYYNENDPFVAARQGCLLAPGRPAGPIGYRCRQGDQWQGPAPLLDLYLRCRLALHVLKVGIEDQRARLAEVA